MDSQIFEHGICIWASKLDICHPHQRVFVGWKDSVCAKYFYLETIGL